MSIYRIRVRRDTETRWATQNPTLGVGEVGFETDTRKVKIGDGSTPWNTLQYINSEAAAHNQDISTINGLQAALDGKANSSHTHAISDVTNLQTTLDGKTNVGHTHYISDVTNLQSTLNSKSDVGHGHAISDVTGLQGALDAKSDIAHTHEYFEVTGPACTGSVVYHGTSGALDGDCDFYYTPSTHTLRIKNASGVAVLALGATGLNLSSVNGNVSLSDSETGAGISLATSGVITIGDANNESNETKLIVDTPSDIVAIYADNGLLVDANILASGSVTAADFYGDLVGHVAIQCKNTSGGPIGKGVPVYITGTVGATNVVEISLARADTPSQMPALGLTETELISNATGHVVLLGVLQSVNTSAFSVGQTVYVGPTGGLVNARPTGVNILVQNIGKVGRVNSNNGEIIVTGPGRTNDVPNSLSLESLYDVETIGVASGQ